MPPLRQLIPFVSSNGAVSVKGILESVIIAGIILFGTVQTLGAKINDLSVQLTRVENTLKAQDARLRVVERRVSVNIQRLNDDEKVN